MNEVKNLKEFEQALAEIRPRIDALELVQVSANLFQDVSFRFYVYELIYSVPNSEMRLEIRCAPEIPTCTVVFQKTEKSEERAHFFLHEYLKKYQIHELKDFEDDAQINRSSIPPLEYFRKYLAIMLRYLEGDLKDILQGKRWEEVPIDWSIADR